MTGVRGNVIDQLVAAYCRAGAGEPAAFELAAIDLEHEPTDAERDEAKRLWRAMPEAQRTKLRVIGSGGSVAPPRPRLHVVRDEDDRV